VRSRCCRAGWSQRLSGLVAELQARLAQNAENLAARYDGHLAQGRAANPPGKRRTKPHALIDRLDQRREPPRLTDQDHDTPTPSPTAHGLAECLHWGQ
jgi:hypothetical protein